MKTTITQRATAFLVALLTALSASSQIAVESFRLLETDLTANTHGTMETDQNNEVAALIKVVTTQQGFTFDGGMLGIVKTIVKPGEIWVYVPKKLQKITIAHPDLGILRDYYFKIPIESARTYEMVLTTGQVVTTVKKTPTTQYLAMTITPPNAVLYIDGSLQPLDADGGFFKLMERGSHTYRVEAAGYKSEVGKVELKQEKVELNITLKSQMATLTLNCADSEAEIVVNNEVKGRGTWKGTVMPGVYAIEARRKSHTSTFEEVRVAEQEQQTIALKAPTPIYGILRVETSPMGAMVCIDDELCYNSKTPCLLDESAKILVGEHEVSVSKEGYKTYKTTITLKQGEEVALTGINLMPGSDDEGIVSATVSDKSTPVAYSDGSSTHNGHEYVDLDLPSGLLWATCNVGAKSPRDYGDYFAWGETKPKSEYSWENLAFCSVIRKTTGWKEPSFSKYNTNSKCGTVDNKLVLDLEDDAAHANWGGNWRVPTKGDWEELRVNCEWEWTSKGGRDGYEVTSKANGKSLFLPAAGYRDGTSLTSAGLSGDYWSSSLYEDRPYSAWYLYFNSGYVSSDDHYLRSYRYNGQSVRPVCRP